jgi:hypothetical protein
MRTLISSLVVSTMLVAVSWVVGPPVVSGNTITPAGRSIPGFQGRVISGRGALRGAPRVIAVRLRRARGEGRVFVRGRRRLAERLLVAAWRLRSRAGAAQTVGRWRVALAGRHPRRLVAGDGGFFLRSGGRRTPALAVFRVGNVVVEVEFRAAARSAAVDSFVQSEAISVATLVRQELGKSAFDRLADLVAAGGPTPQLALRAFAMIGGRGPGVPRSPSHPGEVHGTQALRWVLDVYPRLSAAQRAAVDRHLDEVFPPALRMPTATPASRGLSPARIAAATTAADYQAIIDAQLRKLQSYLPPLGLRVNAIKVATGKPGVFAETAAWGKGILGRGELDLCLISVFPDTDSESPLGQERVIAHELGHCYHNKYTGGLRGLSGVEDWLAEGLPEWIGDALTPPLRFGEYGHDHLAAWDYSRGVALDGMGYHAAGFFGHVADVIGEGTFWSRIPQVLTHKNLGDGGLEATVGSNAPEVYDTWGPSLARIADLGRAWTRTSPSPLGKGVRFEGLQPVLVGEIPVPMEAPRLAGQPYKITSTTPFMRIKLGERRGTAFGRFVDRLHFEFSARQLPNTTFCMIDDCSKCPSGTEGTPPKTQPLNMPLVAGLSGGDTIGNSVILTGEPWSKYCRRTSPPSGQMCPLPNAPATQAAACRVFSLRIPWPSPFPGPLLDIHSCTGLRGPWRGTLNLGPTTLQRPRHIRFTTPTTLTGTATGNRPVTGGVPGEVHALTLTWNIPVRVSAGARPTMSFPGATRRLVTVVSAPEAPDTIIDTGNVTFPPLANRTYPLRTSSAACR